MFNLLTAEKIKVWKSRKMWVSLGLMVVLPLFYSWNEWYMHTKYGNELNQATDTVINGATGILMVEKMAAWILLAFAAFACFYIGEEFQNGTIRNTLSLGRNRMTYYVSKLLVTLLITTLGVVLITGLAIIAYTLAFGFGEVEGIKNYGNYVLKVFPVLLLLILATLSVPVALTFITRSTSVSLLLSFLYIMGTAFVPGVFAKIKGLEFLTEWFTETWLMYTDFAQQATYSQAPKMILVSLVTIVVSSALGMFIFQKSDIK
ncbi:ABC transporter permease subunit [Enterococcus faecium]|uniref:ABC transporter permease subunit n=1 Tax=Enterococcus sp. BSD2780120874b_170522_B6 TaxID=2755567 RepID=UPI0018AB3205|nr:ABC transporter permease subunit [Enterococcus sp. BSD2780120874b_170522_B6]EGP4895657.1 ABC transporter permease subunit [Enterococcus faecium]